MFRHMLAKFNVDKNNRRPLMYSLALMVLFFTMFDATMLYMTPLLLSEHNFSKTILGLIIASSSFCGAIFDFLMCKLFKRANFRRFFMLMFIVCAFYPFVLWGANSVLFFVFAMALWGIYFDLLGVGTFDFIGKYVEKRDSATSFGLLQIFRAIAFVLTPIAIGILIDGTQNIYAIYFSLVALVMAFIFFMQLVLQTRKVGPISQEKIAKRRHNLLIEWHLWRKLSKSILPVLLVTLYIFVIESAFWTLAPIFTQSAGFEQYGGLFLTAYTLPALLVGARIGQITKRFGKKRTAMYAMLIGSLVLSSFALMPSELLFCLTIFIASFFIAIALPSINSVYTDFIEEKPIVENEIESLEDFSFNLGYVIGPIMAGLLSDLFSIPLAFSFLGALGVIISLIIISIVPKHINLKVGKKDF